MIYLDDNSKNNESLRIYGTDNSLKYYHQKKSQYFIDSTYRCLPQNIKNANGFINNNL